MPHPRLTRPLHLLAAAALLTSVACADGTSLDNFDVEVSEQTTLPGATPLDLVFNNFPQLDAFTRFNISDSQDFQNSRYSPDDVDSVQLTAFSLTSVQPDTQDLTFLGQLVLYLETSGLPRKEIARCDTFPPGQTRVAFQTTDDDLKAYILARESTLTVDVKNSRRPPQETTLKVDATFDVDIKIF